MGGFQRHRDLTPLARAASSHLVATVGAAGVKGPVPFWHLTVHMIVLGPLFRGNSNSECHTGPKAPQTRGTGSSFSLLLPCPSRKEVAHVPPGGIRVGDRCCEGAFVGTGREWDLGSAASPRARSWRALAPHGGLGPPARHCTRYGTAAPPRPGPPGPPRGSPLSPGRPSPRGCIRPGAERCPGPRSLCAGPAAWPGRPRPGRAVGHSR